jgi:hypothetical protein
MKRPLVASMTLAVVCTLAATMLTSLGTTTLSASAQQRTQTAAARALFVKFMSSHAPMMRATGAPATLSSTPSVSEIGSYNWSGFADVQNTGTGPGTTPIPAVSGSWTIPQVNCLSGQYRNQDAFQAQWVGLDGFTDGTVEQLGTGTQCYEGVEYYYDWYEMYPNATVVEGTTQCINNNVDCPRPGDRIQASVVSTPGAGGNNDYTLKLTDFSNPAESFTAPGLTCPAATCVNASAEWVVERPAFELPFGAQFTALGAFGQTAFTNGTEGTGFRSTTIDTYPGSVYDIAMIDDTAGYFLDCPGQNGPSGQLLLIPTSASSPPGCAASTAPHGFFSVTWDSSY